MSDRAPTGLVILTTGALVLGGCWQQQRYIVVRNTSSEWVHARVSGRDRLMRPGGFAVFPWSGKFSNLELSTSELPAQLPHDVRERKKLEGERFPNQE